jgi:hypothetical protein
VGADAEVDHPDVWRVVQDLPLDAISASAAEPIDRLVDLLVTTDYTGALQGKRGDLTHPEIAVVAVLNNPGGHTDIPLRQ